MKILNDLLTRYAHIQTPHATIKKECVAIIEELLDITLLEKDITVKGNTLWITAPSTVKSAIRMQHTDILELLRERVGDSITTVQ